MSKIKGSRKGDIQDVGLMMIFIFATIVVFFIVTFTYTKVVDLVVNNTIVNSSNASVTVFQKSQDLTGRFDYIGFIILIGMTLGIIITGYLVGGNPIYVFAYFIGIVILVITSSIFSFVWNRISTQGIFGALAETSFPISNFILNNFPVYIAIVGFVGMMVMFAKPLLEQQ